MKKKTFQKSELTSKERKALRQDAPEEQAPAVNNKMSARITAAVLAAVAAIAVFVAIFVPTYMAANYMYESNPVAVITVGIGDENYTLKYELFENESPKAVANFSYLASVGYFDGTVVYDTQNKRVRFGGFTKTEKDGTVTYSHRAYDEAFTTAHLDDFNSAASGRVTEKDHSSLYRYSLSNDSTALKETDLLFSLNAYKSNCQEAATNFQIFADPNLLPSTDNSNVAGERVIPPDTIEGNSRSRTFYSYPIGIPLNDDKATGEAINKILALKSVDEPVNSYFRPPEQTVTVKTVKVYNYKEYGKWNKSEYAHGFESYMTERFGSGVFYSWNRYTYSQYK